MGKTLLITGAGSGIGRATAVRAAEDGYDVVLVGRRKGPLNQTLALLKEGAHSVLPCDVADRHAFRLGLRQVLGEPGFCDSPLVAVFANAGIGGSNEYAEDAGEDRWNEILRVNVTGVYVTLNECKTISHVLWSGKDACRGNKQCLGAVWCAESIGLCDI